MTTDKQHRKEARIFEKIKNGDKKSFEKLFSIYYEPLCNFAYLFVKDREVVEEAVSDVFINIWRKKESINIQLNIKSYLYKSTKNSIISYTRKRRLNVVSIDDYEDGKAIETPETILIKSEKKDHFNQILKTMPKKAGLVFRMHKVDGMKYREIAEVLSISEKTVENHMGNSLRHLRKLASEHPELIKFIINSVFAGISIMNCLVHQQSLANVAV